MPNTAAEKEKYRHLIADVFLLKRPFLLNIKTNMHFCFSCALLTTFRRTFLSLFDSIHQPCFHLLSISFCCGRQHATSLCEVFTINATDHIDQ